MKYLDWAIEVEEIKNAKQVIAASVFRFIFLKFV
jgi:hypothetical protein